MINVVFPEFTITFDNFHPNEENLNFIPPIPLSWLAIHGQIKQICLKIPENHDKSTKSASIHNEIINKLIFPHRLMQRYLIESLFEFSIPEAVKSVDFSDIVMFSNSGDVKIHLRIQLVVMIYYWAYWGLKVEINTFIQLEVSQRVHDPTLHTNSVHFDCVFAQFGRHEQTIDPILSCLQGLDLPKAVTSWVSHCSLRMKISLEFIDLNRFKDTREMGGRCSMYPQVPITTVIIKIMASYHW